MSCAPFDVRDYYFEALGVGERRQVEEHLAGCAVCAADLERLRVTAMTLGSLPEEEIPRRIAFVSDKVFEPSPVLRLWQNFWLSGARMASASALVLAGAIFFHAYRQPALQVNAPTSAAVTPAMDYAPQIKAAVNQAVAESEARYDAKLKAAEAGNERQKQFMMARFQETLNYIDKHNRVMTVASNRVLESGQ